MALSADTMDMTPRVHLMKDATLLFKEGEEGTQWLLHLPRHPLHAHRFDLAVFSLGSHVARFPQEHVPNANLMGDTAPIIQYLKGSPHGAQLLHC